MRKTLLLILSFASFGAFAQGPQMDYWWYNTTGHTVGGILSDVESVYYDNTYVYLKSSGVPNYYQFGQSVFDAIDQDWTFRIPRNPTPASNHTNMSGGPVGLLLDGSAFFNPFDARSWQNAGNWNQIAYYFEGSDFDATGGHSTPGNIYHHHVDNTELHDFDSSQHSPIIGFAWDGYPIYGPFGYADPNDPQSDITRIKPSYQLRNMTQRNTLPDGTVSPGPPINSTYPLGGYGEDWEFVDSSGHLDEYNGRNCVTPEYPGGTYAYFCTVDENLDPRYPYFIGPYEYYGVIANGNTGPNGGNVTIPGNATQYTPVVTGLDATEETDIQVYPNPARDIININTNGNDIYTLDIIDMHGRLVSRNIITSTLTQMDISHLSDGMYMVSLTNNLMGTKYINRLVKQ